ncbi:transferase hexapeptide (six repeat-containing protein) [Sporobacter termitidis DSM 10068]|uniref:Transferase hexapeptide (Six repeat-containing protein) n=1 Tax=Sporobacter termitidis DSM 10068 TaxID=1123282 RepID=A0A1M5Z727_9FIRM|nr:UDP-N-acetylglucosamine pyrophosphorylase [Sporobacter termitidis]SHI19898.1 transferase hexapeptide (six repeat-containing protein) [Sporobacter termitidis DSM 10068]
MDITVESLFDSSKLDLFSVFDGVEYPWDALSRLKAFLIEYSGRLPGDYERIGEFVWVGKGTVIEKSALIKGPAIIGRDCEIRHSAYLRENVLIGNNVVVGNSTEVKNSILFDNAQAPHFNYVGDSILGYKAHIGAGVILSNLKSTGGTVKVKHDNESIETGLRKFGAILGDNVEVGCNSVLNPGTVVGKNSVVYPLSSVRGYIPEKSIYKGRGQIAAKK